MGSTLPKTLTLCSPQQKSHPQMDPRGPPLLSHRENSGLDLPSSPYLTVGPTSLWKSSPSRKGTPPEAFITHIQHPLPYPSPPQGVLGKPHPTESSPSRPRAGLRARAESSQQPERGRGALRPPRPGPPVPRGRSTLSRSSISFSWARRSYSSRVNSPRRVPTSSSAGARAAGAGVAVGAEGLGTTSSWASLQMERTKQSGHGVTGGRGPQGRAQPYRTASSLRCSFSASCHCLRRRASSTRRCCRSSRLARFWAISSSGLSSSWGQALSPAGHPSPGTATG